MDMIDDELSLGEGKPALGFRQTLVANALDRALANDIRKTILERQVAVLITVTNETWSEAIMEPLAARFSRLAVREAELNGDIEKGVAPYVFRRKPPKRTSADDADLTLALGALRSGGSVVGVFSPSSEPMDLMWERHDIRIDVPRPSIIDIQEAFRSSTGNKLPPLAPGTLDGGDLDALDWLLRPRDRPLEVAARLNATTSASVIADDVPDLRELAGYGAAMDWAMDALRTLDRIRAGVSGATLSDLPKGLLLVGPPGTGKTAFGLSLAKTLRVKAVMTSASVWFASGDSHLGAVIKAMKSDVARATASPPGLLFLDECDSITDRDAEASSSSSWWINFVNALLSAIDGAVRTPGLIVVGAANNAERVEKALKRSGRLETTIEIGLPDLPAREAIFELYLHRTLDKDTVAAAALRAVGKSGADIRKIVRDARAAATDEGVELGRKHLFRAITPRANRSDADRQIIARHEAGHALVARALGRRVVALDLDQAVTHLEPPPAIFTDAYVEAALVCFLAGRATDVVLGGAANSGAGGGPASDLAMATALAAARRRTFGFVGLLWGGSTGDLTKLIQDDAELRREIETDLQKAFARAIDLITRNAGLVQDLADALLEVGFMTGDEIAARLEGLS